MAKYRVIDREGGNEDILPLDTSARTEKGWLRVFFSRWPTAKRGGFYASVGDGRTDITSWATGRTVASFILAN